MFIAGLVADPTIRAGFNDQVNLDWLGLYLPIAGFAVWRIVRGFRAEQYAVKMLGDDIATVRDTSITQEINPVIAEISVAVREYMTDFVEVEGYLPGQPGDPQVEAERVLGYRASKFSNGLRDLQTYYAKITHASECHDRKVSECKRTAFAVGVFGVAWTYILFGLSLTEVDVPLWTYFAAAIVGCFGLGWATAEWWSGNQSVNELSLLVRAANQTPAGGTN